MLGSLEVWAGATRVEVGGQLLRHPGLVRTVTIGCSWAGGPDGRLSQSSHRPVEAMATRDVEHSLRTGFEVNLSPRYAAGQAGAFRTYSTLSLAVKVPVPVVLMQFDAAQRHDTGHLFWWEEPRRTADLLVAHAQ